MMAKYQITRADWRLNAICAVLGAEIGHNLLSCGPNYIGDCVITPYSSDSYEQIAKSAYILPPGGLRHVCPRGYIAGY